MRTSWVILDIPHSHRYIFLHNTCNRWPDFIWNQLLISLSAIFKRQRCPVNTFSDWIEAIQKFWQNYPYSLYSSYLLPKFGLDNKLGVVCIYIKINLKHIAFNVFLFVLKLAHKRIRLTRNARKLWCFNWIVKVGKNSFYFYRLL